MMNVMQGRIPEFLFGGAPTITRGRLLIKFSKKLYEIKDFLVHRGAGSAPLDPPL